MNIREEYIKYFESKGHKWIPSSPLVDENDATVLFNTAGMQPLIPYLMGQKHPYGKRLCDYQKCVRLTDLDEVGDKTHHTFFEMLGNWSLGDYFKYESISYSFEFLTKVLNIPLNKLAVTVFKGDDQIPRDDVSANRWKELGISEDRIAYLGRDDNFWSAGDASPCGGDTEIFYFRSDDEVPSKFDPSDDRWVEIWNNVFMEYYIDENGNVSILDQKNVDTGMGLERIVSVMEGVDDNYLSSIWKDIIDLICDISKLDYSGNEKAMRIIADHIKASVFIISSGVKPSNTDRGYILRRLIRRMIRYAKEINIDIESDFDEKIALLIIDKYVKYYPELDDRDGILSTLREEKRKFNKALVKGLREFERLIKNSDKVDKNAAFKLYDTYGFPIELTIEEAKKRNMDVDVLGFNEKFKQHQEKSRTASKGMFKGGLLGHSEIETKYHTATHLLNAALKKVIGSDSCQLGSNINTERLRFDFPCDHKLTDDEKRRIEALVNKWISEDIKVTKEQMSKDEALKSGAECRFVEKYPDIVTVYCIGDFSKELCGGPHVKSTGQLGHFVIKKEQSNGSGVRRIKAILE